MYMCLTNILIILPHSYGSLRKNIWSKASNSISMNKPHKNAAKSVSSFPWVVHLPRRSGQSHFAKLFIRPTFRQAIFRHASHGKWTENVSITAFPSPRLFGPVASYFLLKLDRVISKEMAIVVIVFGKGPRHRGEFLAELFALDAVFVLFEAGLTTMGFARHALFQSV